MSVVFPTTRGSEAGHSRAPRWKGEGRTASVRQPKWDLVEGVRLVRDPGSRGREENGPLILFYTLFPSMVCFSHIVYM